MMEMMERRQVLKQGAAAAALLSIGRPALAMAPSIIERSVDIETPEGKCTTFIARPDGRGPFPVVIVYMDASGVREELRDMARRLARAGFYAVLPNFYYRSGVLEIGPEDMDRGSAFFKRVAASQGLTSIPGIMSDTDSILAYLSKQKRAQKAPIGIMGFCVSGSWVIHAGARHPERIGAVASIHGTFMVTDQPDSAHLAAPKVKGELYMAYAEQDPFVPPADIEGMRRALRSKPDVKFEIYKGARHGFAFPLRYAYDKPSADLLFSRLEALFRRRLALGS